MLDNVQDEDFAEICALWNYYIENSTATFRTERIEENYLRALSERCIENGWAFLRARNEKLLGFAFYRPFREADGYFCSMEHSIYLDKAAHGRGIGANLLAELERIARAGGVHSFVGVVTADNATAVNFHFANGFRMMGGLREIAYKSGRYHDLSFMQKILD